MEDLTLSDSNPSQDKLNVKQTFLIGLGFMSCMLAWGMYNFYMPRILAGHYINDVPFRIGYFTGDWRLFWANLIMTLDNITAIFLQPFFGELSDRLRSKYGRRTPFLIIGIPTAAGALFLMPFIVNFPGFILIFISFVVLVLIFNLSMAFYRAPVVALMPDLTPSKHRSTANVIINIMGGIGTTIGFMIPSIMGSLGAVKSRLVGNTTFENQNFLALDIAVFWSTGIFMLIVLGLYLIFVHEVPTGAQFWKVEESRMEIDPDTLIINPNAGTKETKVKYRTDLEIKAIFAAKEKSLAFMFLAIFFWSACDDAFGTNLSLWGAEYALLPDTALGSLSLVMTVFVLILGVPGAALSKRKGRLWTLRIGMLLLAICFFGLIIFQEIIRAGYFWLGFVGIMICLGLKAGGGGFIGIAAITVIWQMAPKDKIGTYTGLYYVFKQTGSVLSPLLVGFLLALITPLFGNTGAWVAFVPICLIISLLALFYMMRVKRGEVGDSLSEEELAELARVYGEDD
jgi:MFS family permease